MSLTILGNNAVDLKDDILWSLHCILLHAICRLHVLCASVIETVWGTGMQEANSLKKLLFHSIESYMVLVVFTERILVSNIFSFLSQHKDFQLPGLNGTQKTLIWAPIFWKYLLSLHRYKQPSRSAKQVRSSTLMCSIFHL